MPTGPFTSATNPLTVVSLKPKAAQEKYMEQARAMFDEKYPEFAQDDEFYEDFKNQMGRKGFMNALVDSGTGEVKGLAAGVVFGETLKTAALTYILTPDNDPKTTATLLDKTLTALRKNQNVQGVFIETFKDGQESEDNAARDAAERKLFADAGAHVVPISYQQPLEPEDASSIKGLALRALFSAGLTDMQKGGITFSHLQAMTKLYDPELQHPENVSQLKLYGTQLNAPKFNPAPGSQS